MESELISLRGDLLKFAWLQLRDEASAGDAVQKANLRHHLLMCEGCRNFNKQMQFLRERLKKSPQKNI
jgi:predicted anti-sigma-YlaC factor YlaD